MDYCVSFIVAPFSENLGALQIELTLAAEKSDDLFSVDDTDELFVVVDDGE